MKTLFLEARSSLKAVLSQSDIDKLPKELALFTTVQFIGSIDAVKKQLEENSVKVELFKPQHAKYKGQLLGCSVGSFPAKAFLYIGDGLFHPIALKIKNKKPVYIYNPFTKILTNLTDDVAEKIRKRTKAALIKFYSSTYIGVVLSTKLGQTRMKEALALKKRYPQKHFTFLVFDSVDFSQLENFPFIECFVNTACQRIVYDDYQKFPKPVINLEEVMA